MNSRVRIYGGSWLLLILVVAICCPALAQAGVEAGQTVTSPVSSPLTSPSAAAAQGVTAQQAPAAGGQPAPQEPAGQQQPAPAAQQPAGAQPAQPPQPGAQAGPIPVEQTLAPAPLRVMVGKSILINTADRIRRVSVTDPAIADAMVVTPNQILIHGRTPGEVSLIVWNEQEESRSFDLRVDVDVTAAAQEIASLFPDEKVNVSASRGAIVLSGHVATKDDSDRLALIAGAYSPKVVNVLTFGPLGAQEVVLEVKFAEVDRAALLQWGFNLFSTGATNTIGQTSTQQFGNLGSLNLTDATRAGAVPTPDIATPVVGAAKAAFQTTFTINDLLNTFIFRPDLHLGAVIKALQQKNLLQILAEPNLIALNGKESNFLAGGEFPFPVVTGTGGAQSVSIQFKEFGVRLAFTPLITPSGNIHLVVTPEVSTLDFTNALTISGFFIPALSTRRATTELELQDGQSFVIAGLMDNRVTNVADKIPGLGSIPILGTFFRSKNQQKSTTELLVLVTARRISPSAQPAPLPKFPEPWLNGAKPEAAPAGTGN